MAIKKVNRDSKLDSPEFKDIIYDLAMEITVGGDRFDRDDLCFLIIQSGGDKDCLAALRERVVEKAMTMQPDGDRQVEFFNNMLNYWLSEDHFENCRMRFEYKPNPIPLDNVCLSQKEAAFTVQLEREFHRAFCEEKLSQGWILTGDYDTMLNRALPNIDNELKMNGGVLRKEANGFTFDGKPINDFPLVDRQAIATNALGAAGLQNKVNFSDKLKNWELLNEKERNFFYRKAWSMMKSFVVFGYSIDEKNNLSTSRAKSVPKDDLVERLSSQMHEYWASFQGELGFLKENFVPFDALPEGVKKEMRSDVNTMFDLMERKQLRPVMPEAKKVKSNNISI